VIAILVAVVTFAAMEGVSYAAHRWVMHGRSGIGWHVSHHRPASGRWERNDLFPAVFSVVGFGLFAAAIAWPVLWPVAVGVTAYGVAYLVVHELFIHRRLAAPLPSWRYFDWLRRSHALHHRYGGEPYGMLLPVVPRELRERAAAGEPDVAGSERLVRRASTRPTRSRL
jgi:beta-carotene 3-hydroxylase